MGFEPVTTAFVRPQCLLLTAITHLNKFSTELNNKLTQNQYFPRDPDIGPTSLAVLTVATTEKRNSHLHLSRYLAHK